MIFIMHCLFPISTAAMKFGETDKPQSEQNRAAAINTGASYEIRSNNCKLQPLKPCSVLTVATLMFKCPKKQALKYVK